MPPFFPKVYTNTVPAMVFVDGENLAIRYGHLLQSNAANPPKHVFYEPEVYVWSVGLNNICSYNGVVRRHYYTAVLGDSDKITEVIDKLKTAGIEAPNVFKKTKTKGSKRVDISLATDMLSHAARKNYEIAVLVAGDEDYVPLVESVKNEGRRVVLWFVSDGLSPALRRSADFFANLDDVLLLPQMSANWR